MTTYTATEVADGMFEFFADGAPMNKCACLSDLLSERAEFVELMAGETGDAAALYQEVVDAITAQIEAIGG